MRARLTILIGICLTILVGLLLFRASKPTLVVNLNGEHNPLTTLVMANSIRLEPTGEGGSRYVGRVSLSDNEITVSGPYIETYSATTSLSPFSTVEVNVAINEKLAEAIIAEAVSATNVQATRIRTFQEKPSLIAYLVKDGVLEEDSFPSLLVYDTSQRTWQDVTNSYIEDRSALSISDEAKRYYDSLSTD